MGVLRGVTAIDGVMWGDGGKPRGVTATEGMMGVCPEDSLKRAWKHLTISFQAGW